MEINLTFYIAMVLVTIRLSGILIVASSIFPKSTPRLTTGILLMVLGYMITLSIDYNHVAGIQNTFTLIYQGIGEFSTGVVIGFIVNLFFVAVRIAGSNLDMVMGFSMASLMDPSTGENSTFLERFFNHIAGMVFLILDGHHMVISALVASYNTINIGDFILDQEVISRIIVVFKDFFVIGIKISIPILFVILITDITMAFISRSIPQINVMIIGMPVKMLLGMGILLFFLPIFIGFMKNTFSYIPSYINNVFGVSMIFIVFNSEKTEEPTGKKLGDARKKGQVAKSQELSKGATLIAAIVTLVVVGDYMVDLMSGTFIEFLSLISKELTQNTLFTLLIEAGKKIALLLAPILVILVVAGVASNIMQTGFMFISEPLKPDIKKLDMIKGFKNLFSPKKLATLFKNLAILFLVTPIAYNLVKSEFLNILSISYLSDNKLLSGLLGVMGSVFPKLAMVFFIIGLVDFIYQKRKYKKDMKMSKQEVKEEYKQMEGSPEIKSKRRQKMQELSRARMMSAVPDATVVITNPTHIAVALKYDEGGEAAPKVVAKGEGNIALKIKELAKENDVPIFENKPLARLIYKEVEVEEVIPVEMYQAVAEVLAAVMKLKKK